MKYIHDVVSDGAPAPTNDLINYGKQGSTLIVLRHFDQDQSSTECLQRKDKGLDLRNT